MATMSAIRSVTGTVAANLVMGDIISTCGRSCRDPILCWPSEPWPPMWRTALSGRRNDRHGVWSAGPGGRDNAAELAGLARIPVGSMRGGLLMPDIDDPDAFIKAAVIDVDDVAAAQREDRVHTLVSECFCHQAGARQDVGIRAPAV